MRMYPEQHPAADKWHLNYGIRLFHEPAVLSLQVFQWYGGIGCIALEASHREARAWNVL